MSIHSVKQSFQLDGQVAVVTGGAGLLGTKHCETIAEMGGIPWVIDVDESRAKAVAEYIQNNFQVEAFWKVTDITDPAEVIDLKETILKQCGRLDILINNAANNPKVEDNTSSWTRFENFPLKVWMEDIAVGLTGSFLCSQTLGHYMSENGGGVILNIASDLGVIAPDQRIYKNEGENSETQSVKPVTYSVVKSGLIGLTRYLSTYWAEKGVRANALAPGGVEAGQDEAFKKRLENLIPMARMAHQDEYKSAVAFLVSDASSYMNGSVISIDGGRTAW